MSEASSVLTLSSNSQFPKVEQNLAPEKTHNEIIAQKKLPEGLQPELLPKHVAVIMDGNRRWALERGLSVELGHRAGGGKMRAMVKFCNDWGIKVLTVFAFSTENWVRPMDEVEFLMNLFEETIESDFDDFVRQEIRVSIIGDKSKLPMSLQESIISAEEALKNNNGLHLMVALNYGGRQDIIQTTKNICSQVKDGLVSIEDINESMFEKELLTNCCEFPNPDIVIRTSGEKRISNFMLWQLAYTELFFVNKLFPDFEEADFVEVLKLYQRRQRRFGGHKY